MNGVVSAKKHVLSGTISPVGTLSGSISSVKKLSGKVSVPEGSLAPAYTGPYEYTPAETQQVINISGQKAVENIVIKPVPGNYGRIAWNGTSLRVY